MIRLVLFILNYIYFLSLHTVMKITNNQRPRTQSLPYKGSSKLSKYKMIMNDLYVDCGYPQDIITQPKPHEDHNFI